MGNSKKIIREFPKEVKEEMGFSLHIIQQGLAPDNVKAFKGNDLRGVMELIVDFKTDTYRAVYSVKIDERLYVLHTFKKKSNKGISTPKKELDVIKARFKQAKELSRWLNLRKAEDE